MSYTDRFLLADDYINYVDSVIGAIPDDFIKSRYVGFLSISAVTAYELAFKDIVIEFAEKKHKILGCFARDFFEKLNGRVSLGDIQKNHLPRFGEKYLKKFKSKLESKELEILRSDGRSVRSSYGNVISWRNAFAHEGVIPQGPTYEEARQAYMYGKHVLDCLAIAMVR